MFANLAIMPQGHQLVEARFQLKISIDFSILIHGFLSPSISNPPPQTNPSSQLLPGRHAPFHLQAAQITLRQGPATRYPDIRRAELWQVGLQ